MARSGITTRGEAVRQRIVESTGTLARERGLANTSLDDIGDTAQVSRSQLFHYFPEGRESLLLAVLRYEAAQVLEDQDPFLHQLDSWEAWAAWRDLVVQRYAKQGSRCPMSVLISQLGSGSREASNEIVAELLGEWARLIAAGVRSMQGTGEIIGDIDPAEGASTVLAAIQGGVVLLMATGEIGHLEIALGQAIAGLGSSARNPR